MPGNPTFLPPNDPPIHGSTEGATPVRVQLSRAKGWRMPANTVKVDRTTKWGSPFVVGVDLTGEEAVALHRSLLLTGRYRETASCSAEGGALYAIGVRMEIEQLRGKNLACWCPLNQPCHADVLLEMANAARGNG